MFTSVRVCLGTAIAVAVVASASAAAAATASLSVERFDRQDFAAAQGAMAGFLDGHTLRGFETFEDAPSWNGASGSGNPQATRAGGFTAFGGAGSGHSVVGPGSELQVRGDNDMAWGRYDADDGALGGNWLDSNDNLGMTWQIAGLGSFDSLAFFVTDAADVGGTFSIKVGDTVFSDLAGTAGRLKNGNIQFVRIMLSEAVDSLTVELMHDRTNDGFGIDGAAVAIEPIPLPPAALLLLTGIAGIAGIGRVRRRTA
jgi:hypothetical protein